MYKISNLADFSQKYTMECRHEKMPDSVVDWMQRANEKKKSITLFWLMEFFARIVIRPERKMCVRRAPLPVLV